MKTSFISLLTLQAISVLAASAASKCGALGVMEVPDHIDAADARACREHPLSLKSDVEPQSLNKRDCWTGRPVGCTDGYCWKSCQEKGSGYWCWLAQGGGYGDWQTCGSDEDCMRNKPQTQCGRSHGDCDSCGCSC